MQTFEGQIVDIHQGRIFNGRIEVEDGRIKRITEGVVASQQFILPGFIDAHIHIESSMLVPSEFARLAVLHGTVATVSDPHEIANVVGVKGVDFMIENGSAVPLKFYFGAPSCVPATSFETAGAVIDSQAIRQLISRKEIVYLAEMMNYPGVLFDDEEVMAKIKAAKEAGKPIDGHAPGLTGPEMQKYVDAGISTDHECFTYSEAKEKLHYGMKVIIREGSAAKNFEALIPLLAEYPDQIMFCSDDKHPDDLLIGHINTLVARAVAKGHELFDVLRAASLNPVRHYNLDVGLLQEGDPADFIMVSDLKAFKVNETWIDGQLVAKDGISHVQSVPVEAINQFHIPEIEAQNLRIKGTGAPIRVIEAMDGELITRELIETPKLEGDWLVSDPERDILKIVVVNRYQEALPAVAFIHNFGLDDGALASCVAHDSHNIIAVGVSDEAIAKAVNLIIGQKGGISAVSSSEGKVLPLPIAGIMTDASGETVGAQYAELDNFVKSLGSQLAAPFMTLSFMGLLVIPSLKLSDLGLFDGNRFEFVSLEVSKNQ